MTHEKPALSGTSHPLPFDRLSPRDFERLCLWLVKRKVTNALSTWAQ